MKDETNIPAEIIEWLHSKNFASLSAGEQKAVLNFMSGGEYDELHSAHQSSSGYFDSDKHLKPALKVKQNLDLALRKRQVRPASLWLQPVALWKVAAVFLLFFSVSCLYLRSHNASLKTAELLVHDTVFTEKKIEVIRHIIDTVVTCKYIVAGNEKKQKRLKSVTKYMEEQPDTAKLWRMKNVDMDIRSLQSGDLMKELPNNNGKSMQEDELVRTFGFVRI